MPKMNTEFTRKALKQEQKPKMSLELTRAFKLQRSDAKDEPSIYKEKLKKQ